MPRESCECKRLLRSRTPSCRSATCARSPKVSASSVSTSVRAFASSTISPLIRSARSPSVLRETIAAGFRIVRLLVNLRKLVATYGWRVLGVGASGTAPSWPSRSLRLDLRR